MKFNVAMCLAILLHIVRIYRHRQTYKSTKKFCNHIVFSLTDNLLHQLVTLKIGWVKMLNSASHLCHRPREPTYCTKKKFHRFHTDPLQQRPLELFEAAHDRHNNINSGLGVGIGGGGEKTSSRVWNQHLQSSFFFSSFPSSFHAEVPRRLATRPRYIRLLLQLGMRLPLYPPVQSVRPSLRPACFPSTTTITTTISPPSLSPPFSLSLCLFSVQHTQTL